MNTRQTDRLALGSYFQVILRWKWLVLAVTAIVALPGVAFTWTPTPLYSARSQFLYVKQIDIQNPQAQSCIDTTAQQAEIESVPVITASSQVRNEAQKTMDPSLVSSNYSVSATLQPGINNLYSNVVTLTGVSSNATLAAVAANAYAQAFVAWGRGGARSQVASSISDAR